MKKILQILFILAYSFSAYAQTKSEDIKVDSSKSITVYAELLGYNTNVLGLGKKAKVEVEFGEESWGWTGNDGRNLLVDENGKDIKFNSMVDAMNYMGERGWKFEAAYVVTVSNQNVIHWLMSKEIKAGENARDGIRQRRDNKRDNKKEKTQKSSEPAKVYGDDIYK